MPTGKVSPL